MRIGIDIDGVITNIGEYQIDIASKYFYEKDKSLIKNIKAYNIEEMFETSVNVDKQFWMEFVFDYVQNIYPRKYASEVIKKLKEQGHEIYIITARIGDVGIVDPEEIEKMKNATIEWLKKYDIEYDKIFFTSSNKVSTCQENNIELMIEDSPKNITELSENNIKVMCYHNSYNEQCIGQNILRGYSWYDIYAKLNEMGRI